MQEKNPIQVSERIFSVLEFLAENGPTGLLELSKQLQLNKTTVHRILSSLMYMNYIRQDEETLKYSLTFKVCSLANHVLKQSSIIDLAKPFLKECAELSGETVHLVQMDGINAIYIDKVETSQSSVRLVSMVGKSIPLYCSGVGKAMLADKTDKEIEDIWQQSEIRSFTPYTITELTDFLPIIYQIRQSGLAYDNEENELGVKCIAASIKDFNGKTNYALSISAPKERMSNDKLPILEDLVLSIKHKIETALGS